MISFLKTQPVEYACLIDLEFAHVSRVEHWLSLAPASTEELLIGTSEKRLLYANQSAENDLCKQPVGEIDEDAAWK